MADQSSTTDFKALTLERDRGGRRLSVKLVQSMSRVVLAGEVFGLDEITQLEEVREALEPLVDTAPASDLPYNSPQGADLPLVPFASGVSAARAVRQMRTSA